MYTYPYEENRLRRYKTKIYSDDELYTDEDGIYIDEGILKTVSPEDVFRFSGRDRQLFLETVDGILFYLDNGMQYLEAMINWAPDLYEELYEYLQLISEEQEVLSRIYEEVKRHSKLKYRDVELMAVSLNQIYHLMKKIVERRDLKKIPSYSQFLRTVEDLFNNESAVVLIPTKGRDFFTGEEVKYIRVDYEGITPLDSFDL